MRSAKIREKLIGMTTYMCMLSIFLAVGVALVSGAAVSELWANDASSKWIPFSDAKIIIEFNATDEDVGIQVFLDGKAWKKVIIFNPKGRMVAKIKGKGNLKGLGLTELFFESHEPPLEDLPLEDFLALFPEGVYKFVGKTVEGEWLRGMAKFTHVIPDGALIVSPEEGEVVDPNNTVISWNPVTSPQEVEIVGYQVIVEREDPHRVFSVNLSATTTSMKVPPEFLESDTEYKFEVLAIEVSGNQTITSSFFKTE
ncbi:MAG: fibronectin type III domain-containing protein [bacterium]|nr:fibronectin type III domain-containing protein [bacterium]